MRLLGWLAFAALVSGCAATAAPPQDGSALPSTGTWQLPVSFPVPDLDQTKPSASVQMVRGSMSGMPDGRFKLDLPFDPRSTVRIDLARLHALAAKAAAAADRQQLGEAVKVDPPEARFARVGTVTAGGPYSTGIVGADGDTGYLLVYFDRRCNLRGVQEFDGQHVQYDVAIPDAGFHWLQLNVIDATRQTASRVPDVPLDVLSWRVKRDPR